jgi:hypothetical protein
LQPVELWWLLKARTPPKMFGSLSEHDVNEIIRDLRNHGTG